MPRPHAPHVYSQVIATNPVLLESVAAVDQDREFPVPANFRYQVLSIYAKLVTATDAGNRQMRVEIRDGSNKVLGFAVAGKTQAVDLTYHYCFAPGNPDLTDVIADGEDDGSLLTPIPGTWILWPAWDLRVYVSKGADADVDNLTVHALVDKIDQVHGDTQSLDL